MNLVYANTLLNQEFSTWGESVLMVMEAHPLIPFMIYCPHSYYGTISWLSHKVNTYIISKHCNIYIQIYAYVIHYLLILASPAFQPTLNTLLNESPPTQNTSSFKRTNNISFP